MAIILNFRFSAVPTVLVLCMMYTVHVLQVLSESVSKALKFSGDTGVEETARFVELMDKMFDCLNVHNFSHGYHARKLFQLPYRSAKDNRLQVMYHNYYSAKPIALNGIQWLRDVFLKYLDDWEKSVDERPGFTKEQKNLMLLSPATRLGLRMTGTSKITFQFQYATIISYPMQSWLS